MFDSSFNGPLMTFDTNKRHNNVVAVALTTEVSSVARLVQAVLATLGALFWLTAYPTIESLH
jgi:hypothetical protein